MTRYNPLFYNKFLEIIKFLEVITLKWAEICVVTKEDMCDIVSSIFHDIGAKGVLIEDPALVNTYIKSGLWDYTDIPLSEVTGEVTIKAWLSEDEDLPQKIEQLKICLAHSIMAKDDYRISISNIKNEDWENNWKQYFHPEKIGKKIVVCPSWEKYEKKEDEIIIDLDPGMAFGTGTHPTTSMCIAFLEDIVKKEDIVFDVGTGSGILAIAAKKLGAKEVLAADFDNVAVKVAKENIEKNHLKDEIAIFQSDLLKNFSGKGDLIIANIIADIIIKLLPSIKNHLKEDGLFLASGIIEDRALDVINAVKEHGLYVKEEKEKGGWVALLFSFK